MLQDHKWTFYERFHGWFLAPAWQCCEECLLCDEKMPGVFKTEWCDDAMVALCNKTIYFQASEGQDKLPSKGSQKVGGQCSPAYLWGLSWCSDHEACRQWAQLWPQPAWADTCSSTNRRGSPTIKDRLGDGILTESLSLWATRILPPSKMAAPAPSVSSMRYTTCSCSGPSVCWWLVVQWQVQVMARQSPCAPFSCWMGHNTWPSNWPQSPGFNPLNLISPLQDSTQSMWTTCRPLPPTWWVPGSHASSIIMTHPSFTWSWTSLKRIKLDHAK